MKTFNKGALCFKLAFAKSKLAIKFQFTEGFFPTEEGKRGRVYPRTPVERPSMAGQTRGPVFSIGQTGIELPHWPI